jgi:hypothetical protein
MDKRDEGLLIGVVKEILDETKEIRKEQSDMGIQLARNTDLLDEHIRRTNLLEAQMDIALTPIRFLGTLQKVAKWVAAVAAAVTAIGSTIYFFLD